MRFIKKYFLVAISLLVLMSCNNDKALKLHGVWRMADVKVNAKSTGSDDLLSESNAKKTVQEGWTIALFSDSSYSVLNANGVYEFGTWHLNEDESALVLSNKKTEIPCRLALDKDVMSLNLKQSDSENEAVYFKIGPNLANYKHDPYHPDNLKWRIKATQLETPAQLKERFGNYVQHIAYLLSAATERKQQVISFEYSQGLIKIYNGGIGFWTLDKTDKIWIDAFYNYQQAEAVQHMFSDYLENSSYRGSSTNNWFVDDYNILIHIYADLKEGKFPEPIMDLITIQN